MISASLYRCVPRESAPEERSTSFSILVNFEEELVLEEVVLDQFLRGGFNTCKIQRASIAKRSNLD